jgi:hypothetical protein
MFDDLPASFHHFRVGGTPSLCLLEGLFIEMATDEVLPGFCTSVLQKALRASRSRVDRQPILVHDLLALKHLACRTVIAVLFGIDASCFDELLKRPEANSGRLPADNLTKAAANGWFTTTSQTLR